MLKLFEVCFWVGVLYTGVSFILGEIFHVAGMGSHVGTHIEGHFDLHVNGDFQYVGISPLKPTVIASFITVFGGVGMIMMGRGWGLPLSAAAALISAFAAAFMMYRFVLVPLYKAQNSGAVSQKRLIGEMARVSLGMGGKDFGKIQYIIEGNTYSAPAKSVDGEPIQKGAPVVIIDIQRNTYFVKQIKGGE